jgi:hypothetical protein
MPSNIAITPGFGDREATSTVSVHLKGEATASGIHVLGTEVQAACTIGAHLIILGTNGVGDDDISLIDLTSGKLIDSFLGLSSSLSPDRRWLVRRDFYPPQTEVNFSEEYLIYDTSKDASGNAAPHSTKYTVAAKGRVVFPVVDDGTPFEHNDLPSAQSHVFRSADFYWSDDSKVFLFADSVKGVLSLVAIAVGDSGTQASVRRVVAADVCTVDGDGVPDGSSVTLSGATIAPMVSGDRTIDLRFTSANEGACKTKPLSLQMSDFVAAAREVPPPPPTRGTAVQKQ